MEKIDILKKVLIVPVFLLLITLLTSCGDKQDLTTAVPDPTYVDKSDLAYVDSLDAYKKDDWNAVWIWNEINAPDMYVAFRKTFTLDEEPGTITASISAESKYYLWVNGELTVYDGNDKRGPTIHDTYYDEIDITNLKKGENILAFLVIYSGRSSDSNIDPGKAGLLFEAEIDGKIIKSDSSFKTMRLTAYRNKSLLKGDYPNYPQSSMLGEWNVYYDASLSIGDFMDADFDDSSWANAIGVAKAGAEPFNDLYLNPTPKMKFENIVDFENSNEYVGLTTSSSTIFELELPKNRQFSVYFELESVEGNEIIMYTDTYEVGKNLYNFKDTYITSEGKQTYENYPWRSGSRLFIEVPSGVKFTKIGYRPSGYDSQVSSSFDSSNTDLNVLWTKAVNTLVINMRDSFMDTPDRERGPYMGDASNEIDILLYSMDENGLDLIKKTILTEIGWTKTDNLIPSRAPSKSPHEIPIQSLSFILSAYNYYMYSGDEDTIRLFYPVAVNYLKVWNMQDNGLIEIRDGSWQWTDWGTGIDNTVIQTAMYYYALNQVKTLANDLGITTDLEFLNVRIDSIKENFKTVFQQEDGGFRSIETNDDRANALAVLSGLADESDYTTMTKILTDVEQASPFFEKFVLSALCEMGEYEIALNRISSRYEDMIADYGTTLWELWHLDDASSVSVNHGWSGSPLIIIAKYFSGIKPTSKGYETYSITPQTIVDYSNTTIFTVKGAISIEIIISPNQSYTINIDALDSEGILNIPISLGTNINFSSGNYHKITNQEGYTTYTISGDDISLTVS